MSLHFESRWQDGEDRWTGFRRSDVHDGAFDVGLGTAITVTMAIQLARPSVHLPLSRRPYALRIGFPE